MKAQASVAARAASNRAVGARAVPYQSSGAAFPLGTRPTSNILAGAAAAAASGADAVAKKPAPKASAGSAPQHSKLSNQRYDAAKTADPFATNAKKCKSAFSQSYQLGQLPVRLQSSAAKFHVQWEEYAKAGFSADLLVICAAGLVETQHPYCVLAPMMFEELLGRCEGHAEMLAPITNEICGHLRAALLDAAPAVQAAALKATQLFCQSAGPLMLPQLQKVVPALARQLRDKKNGPQAMLILGTIEQTCGPEATKIIKSKVPTYQ